MKILTVLVFFALIGCAAHKTYNQTTTGRVNFYGGVYLKENWNDALKFKRMSWYHGMTLYYDVMVWKANLASPFSKWFSPSEKEFFTKCEDFLVTVGYSADPSRISHVNFRQQMNLNGYDDVVINSFAYHLKSHAMAPEWRINNYKIMGYCKRAPTRMNTKSLAINFPSFEQLEIRP